MKRLICAALILCAALMLFASAELTQTFETKHYTIKVPSDWTVDLDDLKSGSDTWELGYAFAPDEDALCVRASLDFYDSWDGVSLWNSSAEELKDYEKVLFEDYAKYSPELIELLHVGRIPFYVLKLTDEDSVFYWAETMTNGYVVCFECYALNENNDYRNVTNEEAELFISMLKTFEPKLK